MLQGFHSSLAFLRPATHFLQITSDIADVDINSWAAAQGWDGAAPLVVEITTNVVVYASSTSGPALIVDGVFPNGVTLVNNGYILGDGGDAGEGGNGGVGGGGSSGLDGSPGGTALRVNVPVVIDNPTGLIGGGGGGGGGGSGTSYQAVSLKGGGGGGGRSGRVASLGKARNGTNGTFSSAGSGGSGANYLAVKAGPGGNGGNWGAKGANGGTATYNHGVGIGGNPGKAVVGNSLITWITQGTRLGPIVA